jgi:hypothetical protein
VGVLENLKEAALVAQRVGQLELYKQILQAEDEVRDLTREKRRLEDKVEDLERKARLKAEMTFKAPVYYQGGDVTPFCPVCYEKEERAVHLAKNYRGSWYCNVCNKSFPNKAEDDGPAFAVVG